VRSEWSVRLRQVAMPALVPVTDSRLTILTVGEIGHLPDESVGVRGGIAKRTDRRNLQHKAFCNSEFGL
jgi:hypothetical protein